jgi:iron complex outermembrane receptor protein
MTAEEAKAAANAEMLQEVVVTGSRVRRDVYDSPSPILVVTREETMLAGFNSTTESLQSTNVTGGSSQINNAYGGFVTNGGPGANTIGLRGLGPSRTLVMLNGRRVAPAGSRGSVGSADLNVLPSAMVERVEVLRDGASSIYGSDAVAGVINIITRTNLEGLTLEGQFNSPTGGGGEQMRFSLVGGLTGDRYHLGGSVEYYKRENLALGDRDWTLCNESYLFNEDGSRADFIDPNTGKPKCYPIGSTGDNGVTINTLGTPTTSGVPAPGNPTQTGRYNRWRPNSAITTGLIGYEGVSGASLNVRDTFAPYMLNDSLITPAEIVTFFGEGHFELQALGNAELYGEVLLNQRKSNAIGDRQLSLDYPCVYTDKCTNPLVPQYLQDKFPQSVLSGATAMTTPDFLWLRAFVGFGNYNTRTDVDFTKGTAGLRGDLFIDGWRYDTYVSYAKSDATYTFDTWLTDRMNESAHAVAAPAGTDPALVRDGLTCAINVTNPARGCILAPALTPAVIGGQLPQDWVDWTWVKDTGNTKYDETVFTFNIDGPLFDLPAGSVGSAFGLEYRKAKINDSPSEDSQNGNLYNLTSAAPTRGSDSVKEFYAELDFPLLRGMTGVKDLSMNLSGRYTDYDSYGSDETYKIGLTYTATDWLSLRGTYGTSYRAPALYEQFLGGTSGFLSSQGDPCNDWASSTNATVRANCASEGLPGDFAQNSSIRVITAGGADQGLAAETSDNLTVGVILQTPVQERWGSLAFAVDYYDIEIKDGVDRVGSSNLLSFCYNDPDFRSGGGYCRFSERDSLNHLTVYNSYTNVATDVVEGLDYNLRYEKGIGQGSLRVNLTFTQYLTQKNRLFSDDPWDEVNGNIRSPEYTGGVDATFTVNNWRLRYGMDWVASMDSSDYLEVSRDRTVDGYDFSVGDYFTHSLSVEYSSDSKWSAIVGVRNLTDTVPDPISSGYYYKVGNAPLYSGYDYVGRQLFVNFTMSF